MFDKVTLIYIAVSAIIPILYLLRFATYKSRKKKNYKRAFIIALLMFLILIFLGGAFKLVYETTTKDKKDDNTTTTTVVTTEGKTTTTKTTKTTTTTKKTTKAVSYDYDKILTHTGGDVIGQTKKGYEVKNVDGLYYIDGYLVANKTYALPKEYNPGKLNATVKSAADKMFAAAKSERGFNMWAQSGFRSYSTQESIYNRYVKNDGKAKADTYSARPGYSEHQTGLAFDICADGRPCINSGFDNTNEAKWLSENAYKYGFILRYPKGQDKESQTGYMYESWHFRYVGKELAEKLYNNGNWITMEEYFGFTSAYGANLTGA